jgi:hypothetical protein
VSPTATQNDPDEHDTAGSTLIPESRSSSGGDGTVVEDHDEEASWSA